jgi:hypothetical protein
MRSFYLFLSPPGKRRGTSEITNRQYHQRSTNMRILNAGPGSGTKLSEDEI